MRLVHLKLILSDIYNNLLKKELTQVFNYSCTINFLT